MINVWPDVNNHPEMDSDRRHDRLCIEPIRKLKNELKASSKLQVS